VVVDFICLSNSQIPKVNQNDPVLKGPKCWARCANYRDKMDCNELTNEPNEERSRKR